MKLQLVPARTGWTWVRLGVRTFWRQPLAMTGLFFLFMALMSVLGSLPWIGALLALTLLPAATLGLMAATREARDGRFPMPMILFTALRGDARQRGAMLMLGAWYALGFLLVMGLTTLFDGGQFARLYLVGGKVTQELVMQPGFQGAALAGMALYLPLTLLFWHAPALVHWHGVAPAKSMFFSLVACLRNFGAYTVYGLAWTGLFLLAMLLAMNLGALFGGEAGIAVAVVPVALMVLAMFFCSVYFTFADSFAAGDPPHEERAP